MTTTEWIEIIQFISDMLYMFSAFMSGLVLGYVLGKISGGQE